MSDRNENVESKNVSNQLSMKERWAIDEKEGFGFTAVPNAATFGEASNVEDDSVADK
jgi:hypothetical protein